MNAKTTVKLQFPIEFAGRHITEVTLRRATVKDTSTARQQGKTDEDFQIMLTANLAEIEPDAIRQMDMADYNAIGKVLEGFLS